MSFCTLCPSHLLFPQVTRTPRPTYLSTCTVKPDVICLGKSFVCILTRLRAGGALTLILASGKPCIKATIEEKVAAFEALLHDANFCILHVTGTCVG